MIGIYLIFPGCEGKEMRNHAMKKRANEKVKTQMTWVYMQPFKMTGEDLRILFFFFFFFWDEEEEEQVECTGIQSFPPSDIRPCMEECGERICLFILWSEASSSSVKNSEKPWERGCLGMGNVFGNDLVLAIVKQCLGLLCLQLQKA